jgi:lipopolysaccharide export system protein LptA
LTVVPEEGGTARLESPGSRVEAPRIVLAQGRDEASATGGVRCLLKAGAGGTPVGLFPAGETAFGACRVLRLSGREKAYHLEGEARIWQGGRAVQAGEIEIGGTSGEVRARGGVTACFPGRSGREGKEEVIEAGGETMAYASGEGTVRFEGRSRVVIPGARLTADAVDIRLAGAANEVRDLEARGSVVFAFGRYEGRGREAVYDPRAQTFVLTGDPVLAEPGRGESRGDKLTFRLADDKILVETKGQGRSITVVKS